MWVGLRMRRPLGTFDLAAAEAGENPLDWEEDEVWTYSDGSTFDKDINYDMEISSFSTYECVILRSSSSFAARVTRCGGKLYPFICKWKGTRVNLKIPTFMLPLCELFWKNSFSELDCPPGYSYHGPISDGRTCHSVNVASSPAGDAMCRDLSATADDMRRPSVPANKFQAQLQAEVLRYVELSYI